MGALGILRIRKRLEQKIGKMAMWKRYTAWWFRGIRSRQRRSHATSAPLQNRGTKVGRPIMEVLFYLRILWAPITSLPSPHSTALREVLSRPRHPVDAKSMPVPGRVGAKNPSSGHVITWCRPSETAVGKNITGDIAGVCVGQWSIEYIFNHFYE